MDVKPETLTLKPGDEARLDVTIHRRADYNKDVTIDVLLTHLGGVHGNPLPPGVTVLDDKSKTALRAGANQGISPESQPTATREKLPICVLALCHFVVKVSCQCRYRA